MITTKYSSKYLAERKKFLKNNKKLLDKTIKTIKLFVQNSKHPSLNLEKLKGSDIWTIRIDKGNRIFISFIDKETALFLDIGKHDKYKKF